ncbi:hypothetical protein PT285_04805 [Lactobacillus sp. ESL0791]|nr:hypothetical protein [Lactobacillus sp. ESL0791]MDF7638716.1 hypothetical protein [Lactobacillus sp. ESL0791]
MKISSVVPVANFKAIIGDYVGPIEETSIVRNLAQKQDILVNP